MKITLSLEDGPIGVYTEIKGDMTGLTDKKILIKYLQPMLTTLIQEIQKRKMSKKKLTTAVHNAIHR